MSVKAIISMIVGIAVIVAVYLIFQNQQNDTSKSVDSSKLQRTNQSDEPVVFGSKENDVDLFPEVNDDQKKKDDDAGVSQGMLGGGVDYGFDFNNLP